MMIPTLLDFLMTGAIGKLRLGLTADEVRALLPACCLLLLTASGGRGRTL